MAKERERDSVRCDAMQLSSDEIYMNVQWSRVWEDLAGKESSHCGKFHSTPSSHKYILLIYDLLKFMKRTKSTILARHSSMSISVFSPISKNTHAYATSSYASRRVFQLRRVRIAKRR